MRQQLSDFKAEFFKALAHPLRISILNALRDGELIHGAPVKAARRQASPRVR